MCVCACGVPVVDWNDQELFVEELDVARPSSDLGKERVLSRQERFGS